MDEQVSLIHLFELRHSISCNLGEIVVANHIGILEVDERIPHLPDADGPAFEEALNTICGILKVKFRTRAIITFGLEDGLLDSLVCQILFESSIKKDSWLTLNLWFELNSEAGIGKTT